MPPGVSRSHVKKRKVSEESEEQEDSEEQQEMPQLMVATRQRRSAAMKSHKVWDTLKPGAAKMGMEEEQQEGAGESSSGTSAKRTRVTPKRTSKNTPQQPEKEEGTVNEVQSETKSEEKPKPAPPGPVNVIIQRQQPLPPTLERVIVSSAKKVTYSALSNSNRAFNQQHTQPALKRDQLELIEREMEKHQGLDEPDEADELSDEEDEDEQQLLLDQTPRFVLDDGDEDFLDVSGRGGRGRGSRGGRGRGSRGGGRGTSRGRGGRGSRGGGGGGIMRGRILRAPLPSMTYFQPPAGSRPLTNGIYSLQPAGGIVGELAAARTTMPGQPSVVRVLRPAGVPLQSNFQSLRPSSIGMTSSALGHQQQLAETNFVVNKELENYRGRVVAGSSVKEFNEMIDQLLLENQRIADDRTRIIAINREYVNQLKSTHQTAQDIKDNKIRHLEQTLEQVQQKLAILFKQEQLRIVKQGTVPGPDGGKEGPEQGQQPQQQKQQGIQQVIVGESGTQMEASGQAGGGGGQMRPMWQQGGQGQRVRMMGMEEGGRGGAESSQLPQLHPNAPYYEDEMDDEEEFEADDGGGSAEMDDELGAQVTI